MMICYLMIFWKQGMIIFQIGNDEVSFLYSNLYVIFLWKVIFLFYFLFYIFMRPVSGGNKSQGSKFVISYLCLNIIMIIMMDYLWQIMITMIFLIRILNHDHGNDDHNKLIIDVIYLCPMITIIIMIIWMIMRFGMIIMIIMIM